VVKKEKRKHILSVPTVKLYIDPTLRCTTCIESDGCQRAHKIPSK